MIVYCATVTSPIGSVSFLTDGEALRALEFVESPQRLVEAFERRHGTVQVDGEGDPLGVGARLRAYFSGEIRVLENIPVDTDGTPFQRSVWKELLRIPAGSTNSYGRIARELGSPLKTRAVGVANGANPISLVIPCHRVIGEDGTLTGYGGGLTRKAWLLRHEGFEIDFNSNNPARSKVSNALRLL